MLLHIPMKLLQKIRNEEMYIHAQKKYRLFSEPVS